MNLQFVFAMNKFEVIKICKFIEQRQLIANYV